MESNTAKMLFFTLGELIKQWKKFHYFEIAESSVETYESLLPHLESLKKISPNKIKAKTIDQLIAHWRSDDYPKGSYRTSFRRELSLLRQILHFHRKRNNPRYVVPVLPEHFRAVRLTKKPKRKRHLTAEQLNRFLNALRFNPRLTRYYPLALTQFSLGLRIGEAAGLCWDCIDRDKMETTIKRIVVWSKKDHSPAMKQRTKTNQVKIVPITPHVLAELDKLERGSSALIFHNDNKPLLRRNIGGAYNSALRSAGLGEFSGTHLLRHSCASLGLKATGNVHTVQHLLGHSSLKTTEEYLPDVDRDELSKVSHALGRLIS